MKNLVDLLNESLITESKTDKKVDELNQILRTYASANLLDKLNNLWTSLDLVEKGFTWTFDSKWNKYLYTDGEVRYLEADMMHGLVTIKSARTHSEFPPKDFVDKICKTLNKKYVKVDSTEYKFEQK